MRTTTSPSSSTARDVRNLTISLLSITLLLSTAYSVYYSTYLDTSDPHLASLPHPSYHISYFARKSNIFNQWFVKKAWAWTSGVFALLFITSPITKQSNGRIYRYVIASVVWALFTTWFFGPALFERLLTASGGECVIVLPGSNDAHSIPVEYCYTRSKLTTTSHPHIFANLLPAANLGTSDDDSLGANVYSIPADFVARPRLYRGHDVSGHIFLLTLGIMFLTDQVTFSLFPQPRSTSIWNKLAIVVTVALLALWWWMSIMTAVYFHRPAEKLSGFCTSLSFRLVLKC